MYFITELLYSFVGLEKIVFPTTGQMQSYYQGFDV